MSDTRTFVRPGMEQVTTANRGRYYVWGGQRYYSVTTILSKGIPKEALIGWAAKMTAIGAIKHLDKVRTLIEDEAIEWGDDGKPRSSGASAAYKFLTGYRFESRDKAADLGSLVHDIAEAHVLEKPYPKVSKEAQPYVDQFLLFLERFQPVFEAVEAPVFSREQKYAGTLDSIATFPTLGGRRLLLDYKSGSGVYPEVALQLSAYRHADTFLGLPDGSEAPMPEVDGCAVLHLQPDHHRLVEVRTDAEVFRAFLYAREIFRFQTELSKEVIGNDLHPELTGEPA